MNLLQRCARSLYNVAVRYSSTVEMEVWRNGSYSESNQPRIVLFGYYGSPRKNLQKYVDLYDRLGYNTVSCILPEPIMLHYDVHGARTCAESVLRELEVSGAENIVVHCFSNNGTGLYQQLYTVLTEENRAEGFIKVKVF